MERIKRLSAAVLAALSVTGASAADQVVNVWGQYSLCNGCAFGPFLSVSFEAGTYRVTPVMAGSVPGAQYTAYTWGGVPGWSAAYGIALDADHITDYGVGGPRLGLGWPDAATAFAHSAAGSFTITRAQNVFFGVPDSYHPDNDGGVSLLISQVPELPTATLLMAGIVLLNWPRRRPRVGCWRQCSDVTASAALQASPMTQADRSDRRAHQEHLACAG